MLICCLTEEWNNYMRQYMSVWYKKSRLELIALLGNKCVRCGFTDIRALQLDHINGGGSAELRRFKNKRNQYVFYRKHLNEAKLKLQVLCANCNWIKKYENKEDSRQSKVL